MLRTIVAFLVVFSVIVVIHEFGHYYFAKRAGILVREFAIGMGPKIFQFRRGETVYTLRLLPMGGYVRMAGLEDEEQEIKPGMMVSLELDEHQVVQRLSFDERVRLEQGIPFQIESGDLQEAMTLVGYFPQQNEPTTLAVSKTATVIEMDGTEVCVAPIERQFHSASLINRVLTNAAGPLNNFILAIVAFTLVAFLSGGVLSNEPVIGQFTADSAAQQAGLVVGDQIETINGKPIDTWKEIGAVISPMANQAVTMVVKRDQQQQTITVTPNEYQTPEGETIGVLGITPVRKNDFFSKIAYGFTQTGFVITSVFTTLLALFTGGVSFNQLGGPVAIYSITSQVAKNGFIPLVSLIGFLSANLGVMNLLPIPVLDGGKLVLNLIEGIRKKPLSPEKETYLTIFGAAFVIIVMILVTWNDLMRLF